MINKLLQFGLAIPGRMVFLIWTLLEWFISPLKSLWWKLKLHPDHGIADDEVVHYVESVHALQEYLAKNPEMRVTLAPAPRTLYSPLYYKITDPFLRILLSKERWKDELAWRIYKTTLKREARKRRDADETAQKLIGD